MNYQVGQKVKIQSEDWYNTNKQANGFIIFKDGNKISTFSPGMVKFCGQVFTIAKVVETPSSIYPDHYTFVEDGGAYKWSDQMIAGLADSSEATYVKTEQPAAAAPQPKPAEQPKPTEQPKPKAEPKPKKETKPAPAPKTVEMKKEEMKNEQPVEYPAPQEPKPAEQPKPEVHRPEPQPEPQPDPQPKPEEHNEIDAFESYKLLLKPRENAPLADCAVQAFQIISANQMFPEVSFDFNGFEFSITRK